MTPDPQIIEPFLANGLITRSEAQLVATVARLQPQATAGSLLALAITARAVRLGHACVDLGEVTEIHQMLLSDSVETGSTIESELSWPDPAEWSEILVDSPIVATPDTFLDEPLRPLVLDQGRLYLQRYYCHETNVAEELLLRSRVKRPDISPGEILDELFAPGVDHHNPQRRAAELALGGGLTIITGGPGTGKTWTIAKILIGATKLAARNNSAVAIAMAAPTGKAAARINESVIASLHEMPSPPVATTIHALLGWAPGGAFRHDHASPLPHDLVIIDETSMISLSLMASLLDAIKPDASVVLVGDPDQLTSVEVGTVLSDIVTPAGESSLSSRIVKLTQPHRFGPESAIASLASAVRSGDIESATELLGEHSPTSRPSDGDQPSLEWIRPEETARIDRIVGEVIESSISMAQAALRGDALGALSAAAHTKVLAATRMNQFGVYHWSDMIESTVVSRVPGVDNSRRWFVGRPVMVTANDRMNRVANGDTGVVIDRGDGPAVAFPGGGPESSDDVRFLPTSRLAEVESWWAMTIHKSQGSEFRHVVVSLPPPGSPILTRELLYTAITRARERVTIIADEQVLREAIGRKVSRASGLSARLWTGSEVPRK